MLVKRFFQFLIVLCLLAAGAFAYWAQRTVIANNSKPIEFTIQPGSSLSSAARQIVAAGVPMDANLFIVLVRGYQLSNRLQAGTYEMKPGTTPIELMNKLVSGDFLRYTITIIEGWTFAQMRAAIDANPNIRHDTAALSAAQLMAQLAPNSQTSPEGMFFPDTYLFAKGSNDTQLYREAYESMQQHLQNAWNSRASELPYKSPYEALIMASIIEKESGLRSDQALVSGVFSNRLKKGMPLQTDPSVIYGMGDKYHGKIGKVGLETDTPYNTYTRVGLPPTPISLPGAAALEAATHPAPTDALYFVAKGDGSSHFSQTLQEHNAAVDRYIRGSK